MKKLESLTEEQIAKFSSYREKWIKIGLATEKRGFDRSFSEKAIKKAYSCAGLIEPKAFIWTESPLHAGVCYALLKTKNNSVRASVWDSVGASVRASVRASVWASVRASVWDSVGDSVGASVWDSVRASCYGSHDSDWLSFYDFFNNEKIADCFKLQGLWEIAENSGWFIPFENIVIVSPRPYSIKTRINERGNHELHADGEPSVYYCDDFKIYSNLGRTIPEKYGSIRMQNWESKWLLSEVNAELKMVLIKGIGYEKLCNDLEAKKLDSWREYELVQIPQIDVEPIHLLKMTCPSTGHIHVGRVPPDCLKARHAATLRNSGIDPEEFIYET